MSLVKTFYYETRQLNATAIYIKVSATFHSTFAWCKEEWRNRATVLPQIYRRDQTMKCPRNCTSKFQIPKHMHFNITGPVKTVNIIAAKNAQLMTIKMLFLQLQYIILLRH